VALVLASKQIVWIAGSVLLWGVLSCSGTSQNKSGGAGNGGGAGVGQGGQSGTVAAMGGASGGSTGRASGGIAAGGSTSGGTGGSAGSGGAMTGGDAGSAGAGGSVGGGSTAGDGGTEAGESGGGAGGNAGSGGDAGFAGTAAGFGGTSGSGATAGAAGGGGRPGPHCDGVAPLCGPDGTSDCCASIAVPGGAFDRSNDATYPATVSDFRLDTYEVVVGRFRQFLVDYPVNLPAAGSGRNPNNPDDPGWDPALDSSFVTDLTELETRIGRCGQSTWTDEPGANEALPMNCITWFEAAAFCIWDEGRLPTEAEWNYAAAGGAEQRFFPWSSPPESTTIDPTYATYEGEVTVVGSKSPKGDGRWGHADLAGSVFEWAQDYVANYSVPCIDCAELSPAVQRSDRGGGITMFSEQLRTSYRGSLPPTSYPYNVGVRCARAP